jgi:signal transduction histidine kinase
MVPLNAPSGPAPGSGIDDGDVGTALRLQGMLELARNIRTVVFGNIVNSLLAVAVAYPLVDRRILLAWCGFIVVLALVRLAVWGRLGPDGRELKENPAPWIRFSALTSLASGLAWGSAPILFYEPVLTPLQLFLLFLICGSAAAATVTISSHRPTYIAFMVPCVVPPAIWYLFQAEYFHVVLGIMMLIYSGILSTVSRAQHRALAESLRMQGDLGRARDLAEAGNRAKDEFVSVVSHELRTPLTSIAGSLSLLSAGVPDPLPERAGRLVDIATRNVDRLTHLINDLLDFERLESGEPRFEWSSVDLSSAVMRTVEATRGYGDQFDVSFTTSNVEPGISVRGDETRIAQVIANLLSNAAKFSPRGAFVDIRVLRNGGDALVEIQDQGPGIPDGFHDRIFGPFAQAESNVARNAGGVGLGLAISKSIVERHGGTITYRSRPGEGTTFVVSMPVAD